MLGQIDFNSLISVLNLVLNNKRCCSLVTMYTINESSVNKSFKICQMFVDNLRHIAMITQIIDVSSNESPIYVCPTELMQRIETFIYTNVAFPCLARSG